MKGERFTTLDETERTLNEDTVLICDSESPVAVGGIMGGLVAGFIAGMITGYKLR